MPTLILGKIISSGGGDYQGRVRGVEDPSNDYEVYLKAYDPGDYNNTIVDMKIGTGNDDITFDVRRFVENGAAELYIVIQNADSNDDAEYTTMTNKVESYINWR